MLEIGTGWGELAIRAARRGATVHSVTLSSEQLELAERARRRGRARRPGHRRAVRLPRRRRAQYDAIVSVEMIEAVGHEYWPTYFRTIDRVLAPGGRVGIQAITMPHDRMLATRHTYTWIHKYIFPGGFLPSVQAIDEITRADTTPADHRPALLRPALRRDPAALGRRVRRGQPTRCATLGFDETFRRMWHFYLEYSRGGLRVRLHRRPAADLREGLTMTSTAQSPVQQSTPSPVSAAGVAQRLEEALRPFVGGDLPVRLRAWDGSRGRPGRRPAGRAALPPTPYAACCGTRASSGPPRPTSPARSRCTTTSTTR